MIECGPQCTGGNFTDWDTVPGWDDMGYPVAECFPDGSAIITKPDEHRRPGLTRAPSASRSSTRSATPART